MRHQFDKDGMIPYVGEVRASTRWKSSRTRSGRPSSNMGTRYSATDQATLDKITDSIDARKLRRRY